MLSAECTVPRLKLVVLTHPWTKLDTEVRVAPDIASCSWKKGKNNNKTTTPYCKYAGAGGKQGLEVGPGKIIDGLSWPVVPAKVTLARDQQSLWLFFFFFLITTVSYSCICLFLSIIYFSLLYHTTVSVCFSPLCLPYYCICLLFTTT